MGRMAELETALREAKEEFFKEVPTYFGYDDVSVEVDGEKEVVRFVAQDAIYVYSVEFPLDAIMEYDEEGRTNGKVDVDALKTELERFIEKVGGVE